MRNQKAPRIRNETAKPEPGTDQDQRKVKTADKATTPTRPRTNGEAKRAIDGAFMTCSLMRHRPKSGVSREPVTMMPGAKPLMPGARSGHR